MPSRSTHPHIHGHRRSKLTPPRYKDDASTDFTIICGTASFKVHRLVTSIHSDYFRCLCAPDSPFQESAARKVTLQDDPTLAVRLLLDYFYTFDYPEPMSSIAPAEADTNPRNSLEAYSQVFTVADKYAVPGLRDLALKKFKSATKPVFGLTPAFRRTLAKDLVVAIPHVYHNTPPKDRSLRDAVLAPWEDGDLLKFVEKSVLLGLFEEVPEFAAELLAETAELEIGCECEKGKEEKDKGEGKEGRAVDLGGGRPEASFAFRGAALPSM